MHLKLNYHHCLASYVLDCVVNICTHMACTLLGLRKLCCGTFPEGKVIVMTYLCGFILFSHGSWLHRFNLSRLMH